MSSPMYVYYDGARVSTESALGKELLQWERKPDYRPEANPFPMMVYRARHRPDGKRSVSEVNDKLFAERSPDGHLIVNPGAAEQWSAGCRDTVKNEAELTRALQNGWRKTQQEALDLLEERDRGISDLAAERHHGDARMSEAAQREAALVDQSTARHVPVVTNEVLAEAKEKKRRGRPRKVTPVA